MKELKCVKWVLHKIRGTKAFKRPSWYLTPEQPTHERFLDLAPVDNADRDGLYGKALDFAMQNTAIRNIALTGPYGSGKTSVIKTYEKNKHYRFLNVSLATFSDPKVVNDLENELPADDVTVKIERSILQQMLYGTDSSTLPYSRFKRISKPRGLSRIAVGFTFWIIACGYLYNERKNVLDANSLENLEPLWLFVSLYVAAYFAQMVSSALKASHSLSVKRLSLQNGEVELDSTPESSILNKHLDEIIYFFEENKYDAVVFEDLDRFGSPEIFIKLREINKIVNDRPKRRSILHRLKISQPLKFIYAIKDDVFLNKDRAKFFDFITPIVPIINNSNSREMFTECISPKEGGVAVSSRFLSEVSLYLDDFRLIKNISNEFLVYRGKVGGDPNLDKLLAMIVYKNTYPKDFEELHHGNGALYRVVDQRMAIIASTSSDIDKDIAKRKVLISESEAELCTAAEDLVRIFWGQLCGSHQGYYIAGVYSGQSVIPFDQLLKWENFELIFNESPLRLHAHVISSGYGHLRLIEVRAKFSFREIEESVSSGLKLEARYDRIKKKSLRYRNQLSSEIATLIEKKAQLSRNPLRELITDARVDIRSIALEYGISDSRLLSYLIKNGYLDETYHLFISIFHEGRMSRNDWNFIQAIRDFRSLDPNTKIDTPKEVVAEMREEDFGAEYVLNTILIDHLLATQPTNREKLESALDFISKSFADTEHFFNAYWLSGREIEKFTQALAETWPGYALAAIRGGQATKHIAKIIAYVAPSYVAKHMNDFSGLASYISQNAQAIFSENIKFVNGYEALNVMSVEVSRIHSLDSLSDLLTYVYESNLYSISIENVAYVLSRFPSGDADQTKDIIDSRIANYTAINAYGSQPLLTYITENINTYLDGVSLALDSNTEESEASIVEVINHSKVDEGLATQFALKQSHIFTCFEKIPVAMRGEFLFNGKVMISWKNVLTYFSQEDCDQKRLFEYFDSDSVATELAKTKDPMVKDEAEIALSLCRLLISNSSIRIDNFEKLCGALPYNFRSFPAGQSVERNVILANLRVVRLNETSFADTSDSTELRASLIKNSFNLYLGDSASYDLDIEVKIKLLLAVSAEQKITLIKKIKIEELQSSSKALRAVSRFLSSPELLTRDFDKEVIAHCLANAVEEGTVVGILINFVGELTVQQITSALSSAPEPFCNFVKANARQKIELTERNLRFVKELQRQDIISSASEKGTYIQVNSYRKGIAGLFGGR